MYNDILFAFKEMVIVLNRVLVSVMLVGLGLTVQLPSVSTRVITTNHLVQAVVIV